MSTELLKAIPDPVEIRNRIGAISRERLILQKLLRVAEQKEKIETLCSDPQSTKARQGGEK